MSLTEQRVLHLYRCYTDTHKTWNNSIIIPRCLHASDLCCANIPPPHWLAPRSAAPPSARRARRAPRGTAGHHASPWRSWEDSPQPWRSEEAPGPCRGDPEKGPMNGVTITWRWLRVWWYPARINKIWNYPNATQDWAVWTPHISGQSLGVVPCLGLTTTKKRNQDFWFPNFGAYYNKKIIWNFWGLLQPKKIISPPDPLVPLVPPASKVPSTCTSAGWPGCEATRLAAHSESAVPSEKVSASKSFTATVLVGHGRPMGKNSWCQKYLVLVPLFFHQIVFSHFTRKMEIKSFL